MTRRKLTTGVSGAPFEYEYHILEYEYEYEHFWAIRGIIAGNHWFPAFSYSVRRGGRYSYSYSYSNT